MSLRNAFSTLRIPPHVKVRWTQDDAEILPMARSAGVVGIPPNTGLRDTVGIFCAEVGNKSACFLHCVGFQKPTDNGWSALIFDKAEDLDPVYTHLLNGLRGHPTSSQ